VILEFLFKNFPVYRKQSDPVFEFGKRVVSFQIIVYNSRRYS
jgi:hypothetical protein